MSPHRLRPSPAVRASISPDGLVLLDAAAGLVLSSNAVGACIWQLVEQGRTAVEIAERIAAEYAVTRERAERDVLEFVRALEDRGLLQPERSS